MLSTTFHAPLVQDPTYIGQMGQLLQTRLYEHKCTVRKGEGEKSAVVEHAWQEGHQMDFGNMTFLAREISVAILSRGSLKQSGLSIESCDHYLLCTRPSFCKFCLSYAYIYIYLSYCLLIVSAFPYLHWNFLLCVLLLLPAFLLILALYMHCTFATEDSPSRDQNVWQYDLKKTDWLITINPTIGKHSVTASTYIVRNAF